jgi:biotin transport system substrate-specific component
VLPAIILIALGTALLTLSAKVNLPLPYVPMTLQTLVVLMIGAAYGWRLRRTRSVRRWCRRSGGFSIAADKIAAARANAIDSTAPIDFGCVR